MLKRLKLTAETAGIKAPNIPLILVNFRYNTYMLAGYFVLYKHSPAIAARVNFKTLSLKP